VVQEPRDVPVVYLPESSGGVLQYFFPPTRPTPERTAAVVDVAARAVPDARPWFVEAWDGDTDWLSGRPVYTVYFEPEQTAERVRTGRLCVVTWPIAGSRAAFADRLDVDVAPYVQVSEPGAPFGEKVEVPAAAGLPFLLPREKDGSPAFGDAELVEIVDVASAQLRRENGRRSGWKPPPITLVGKRDGLIRVHFRRSEGSWEIVKVSRANGTLTYAGFEMIRR
jgi:hypothetical protein